MNTAIIIKRTRLEIQLDKLAQQLEKQQLQQQQKQQQQQIIDSIISKRFSENKSYRVIGRELGYSYTYVMNIINEYYITHPELQPIAVEKRQKIINKGHAKTEDNRTGGIADILVDGYAAKLTHRYTDCGNPNCPKCKKDSEGHIKGHGPYSYLVYRNSNGSVITKYLNTSKRQEILSKKLTSVWDINITFKDNE